jgi:hypothetical protein
MSAAPAAPTPPTVEELSTLIVALQAQVNALRAAPTAVVFAETPQTMEVDILINYLMKRDAEIVTHRRFQHDSQSNCHLC